MLVVIVGGGIAGLAAALAFAPHADVVVLERRADTEANAGAGIQLAPNANKALAAIAAFEAVRARASAPTALAVRTAGRDTPLVELPYADFDQRFGAPNLTIPRAALHGALLDLARSRGVDVRHETTTDLSPPASTDGAASEAAARPRAARADSPGRPPAVAVATDRVIGADVSAQARGTQRSAAPVPGSAAASAPPLVIAESKAPAQKRFRAAVTRPRRPLVPDPHAAADRLRAALAQRLGTAPTLVVAADGVGSAVRAHLIGDRPRPTGWTAWRGQGTASTADATELTLAPGAHLVRYAIGGQDNCVLITRADQDPAQVAIGPLGRAMVDVTAWTPWPVAERRPHVFAAGPVLLVGDAAHATVPYLAQGAALALEDAAVLARLAAHHGLNSPALARDYTGLRARRTETIAALSRRQGLIYHLSAPAALARDLALRAGGPRLLLGRTASVYRWTPP